MLCVTKLHKQLMSLHHNFRSWAADCVHLASKIKLFENAVEKNLFFNTMTKIQLKKTLCEKKIYLKKNCLKKIFFVLAPKSPGA